MDALIGLLRLLTGIFILIALVLIFTVVCIILLPSRILRIKACNIFGQASGASIMWLSGCPLTFIGLEHINGKRPALYISNHTSNLDLFIAMWMCPIGTVGIGKKQVAWYPFFGQLYLLSGHLLVDRGNTQKAIRSLQRLAALVRENRLSIWIWPEGTRSRTGRLLPFKKGAVHLALQTGLPIVPVIVTGAHKAWEKKTLRLRPVPIEIRALPPIDTSKWTLETLGQHVQEIHGIFAAYLPEEQKPPLDDLVAEA